MKTNALAISRFPRRLSALCDGAAEPNRPRRSRSALRTSKSALRPTRQHSHPVQPSQLIEVRRVRLIMTHAGDVGYWPERFAVCRPTGVSGLRPFTSSAKRNCARILWLSGKPLNSLILAHRFDGKETQKACRAPTCRSGIRNLI